MNDYARRNIPFLFVIDFDQSKPIVLPLVEAADHGIFFDIHGLRNYKPSDAPAPDFQLKKYPVSFERYHKAFQLVQQHISEGNSFLTNLTFPTRVESNLHFREIFLHSQARYKLWIKDQLVVFSPERFVGVQDGQIFSHPMKGTIDASIPNAATKLLNDPKEKAEHFTIVDLIRNDLSRVAEHVKVEKFRYLDRIETNGNTLLQTSSKISGRLTSSYRKHVGSLLENLLPAGSITGAPKPKTVEIIKAAEQYDRGYYTGVFGYWMEGRMESAVMIRYIERQGDQYYFKSGGGITSLSDPHAEYEELINKVYVPIIGKHQNTRRQNLQSPTPRAATE